MDNGGNLGKDRKPPLSRGAFPKVFSVVRWVIFELGLSKDLGAAALGGFRIRGV